MAEIEHVIVVVLENRSYDHMLGSQPGFGGLVAEAFTNPDVDGKPVVASPGAKTVLPLDPDHSHNAAMEQLAVKAGTPTNQGFVTSYERKAQGLARPVYGGVFGPVINLWLRRQRGEKPMAGRGPLVMLCQPPEHVPVLGTLAREFAVCTRWFCSVPGETWPNRNFLHAGTSDGETDIKIRFYRNKTIFELLEEYGHTWRVYHDDTPQAWAFPKLWTTPRQHAKWFPISEFTGHVRAGTLPSYSFIEPNHRPPVHIGRPGISNSQHPGNNKVTNDEYDAHPASGKDCDFVRGERLIASIYEALRNNPGLFERSLLLITYDEHGGFFDHVPPPTDVPAPRDTRSFMTKLLYALWHRKTKARFDFRMLGPRVPAVVVSPYIPQHTESAATRDHAAVPATLRAVFAPQAGPLTERDAWAEPFHTLCTLSEPRRGDELPDLSAHAEPVQALTDEAEPPVEQEAEQVPREIPAHYRDFARQAVKVRRKLRRVGEPEIKGLPRIPPPVRPVQISQAFAEAARRHREEQP